MCIRDRTPCSYEHYLVFLIFFSKTRIFSPIFFIFGWKFSGKKKILRQFSDSSKVRNDQLPLLPHPSRDATGCWPLHCEDSIWLCDDNRHLVAACVLTVRDVNSWWLSIPCAGVFIKTLMHGRRALEAIFNRCKYREILRTASQQKQKLMFWSLLIIALYYVIILASPQLQLAWTFPKARVTGGVVFWDSKGSAVQCLSLYMRIAA